MTSASSALVKAFTEGAESAGHSSKEYPCVQRDDMAQIYPAVRDGDVIVLASPLYYWNMSGQSRTAVDRLFALEEGDGNLLRGRGKA